MNKESQPDNPPAFPGTFIDHCEGHKFEKFSPGMTLRDYFAAKALSAIAWEALRLDHKSWEATAQHAYLLADAMLRARKSENKL